MTSISQGESAQRVNRTKASMSGQVIGLTPNPPDDRRL